MKERLVGAAVLVAIGVWLIPWVLDGPDEPLEADANSLRLPAAEEPMPMRTQTLSFEQADEPPTPASAEPEAPPPAAAAAAEASKPTAPKPAVDAAKPAEAPSKTAAAASSAPPPTAAAASGDWAVQLGSFSEEANARRLAQRVSTLGYHASVENHRSGGRTLFRVRVGPFDTRGKAEATASALGAHGFKGQVVAAAD